MLERCVAPGSGTAGRTPNVQVAPSSSLRPTRIVPRGPWSVAARTGDRDVERDRSRGRYRCHGATSGRDGCFRLVPGALSPPIVKLVSLTVVAIRDGPTSNVFAFARRNPRERRPRRVVPHWTVHPSKGSASDPSGEGRPGTTRRTRRRRGPVEAGTRSATSRGSRARAGAGAISVHLHVSPKSADASRRNPGPRAPRASQLYPT